MIAVRRIALFALAGLAVWKLASGGITAILLLVGLHIVWITLVLERQHLFLAAAGWMATAMLTRSPGTELLLLLAAASSVPGASLADQLASWRDARAAIAAQLRMTEGFRRWLAVCLRQAWSGEPSSPIQAAHLSVQAALDFAARAAEQRIAETVREERFRQLASTAVTSVAAKTSLAFARAAIESEQAAIAAAAQLRSEVRAISMDDADRERLVAQCESLLLALTLPPRGYSK